LKTFSCLPYRPKSFTVYTVYTFVEIDHAKAWKILYQKCSGFFQGLKTTTLTEHFRSINLSNISTPVFLQLRRNENKIISYIAAINSTEVKKLRNSNCNRQTRSLCWCRSSHNDSRNDCLRAEKDWNVWKKTTDLLQTHSFQNFTRLQWKIT